MTDVDSNVEEKSKKNENHCEGSRRLVCFQTFLSFERNSKSGKSIMRRPAPIKGVGFWKTRSLSANLERSGVVVTVKATPISGALHVHHNLILILARSYYSSEPSFCSGLRAILR